MREITIKRESKWNYTDLWSRWETPLRSCCSRAPLLSSAHLCRMAGCHNSWQPGSRRWCCKRRISHQPDSRDKRPELWIRPWPLNPSPRSWAPLRWVRVCSNNRGITTLSLPAKFHSEVLKRRARPIADSRQSAWFAPYIPKAGAVSTYSAVSRTLFWGGVCLRTAWRSVYFG